MCLCTNLSRPYNCARQKLGQHSHYVVCMDCGQTHPYNWSEMRVEYANTRWDIVIYAASGALALLLICCTAWNFASSILDAWRHLWQ